MSLLLYKVNMKEVYNKVRLVDEAKVIWGWIESL